jgi:hypothetical protein
VTITREPIPDDRIPSPARPRWWVLGVVLAVMGAAALFTYWPRTPDEVAQPTTAPAEALPPAVAGADCSSWPADPGIAVAATWTLAGTVPAPSAEGVGPAKIHPIRWCYAHTKAGALFAATNFISVMNTSGVNAQTLASHLLADTQSRKAVTDAAAALPAQGLPGADQPTTDVMQWVGYHVITYKSDTAILDVAHRWKGQLVAAIYQMRWEQGDWKLVYPDDLKFSQRVIQAVDPGYFTLWGSP